MCCSVSATRAAPSPPSSCPLTLSQSARSLATLNCATSDCSLLWWPSMPPAPSWGQASLLHYRAQISALLDEVATCGQRNATEMRKPGLRTVREPPREHLRLQDYVADGASVPSDLRTAPQRNVVLPCGALPTVGAQASISGISSASPSPYLSATAPVASTASPTPPQGTELPAKIDEHALRGFERRRRSHDVPSATTRLLSRERWKSSISARNKRVLRSVLLLLRDVLGVGTPSALSA